MTSLTTGTYSSWLHEDVSATGDVIECVKLCLLGDAPSSRSRARMISPDVSLSETANNYSVIRHHAHGIHRLSIFFIPTIGPWSPWGVHPFVSPRGLGSHCQNFITLLAPFILPETVHSRLRGTDCLVSHVSG